MEPGSWIAIIGIVISWVLYGLGQLAVRRRDLEAARALLSGVLAGMAEWGDEYFGNPYDAEAIEQRAQRDRAAVMTNCWIHVFEFPTEPVAALMSGSASTYLSEQTIEAAGLALWQMRLLNALIRQHADLGRQHLAEIADPTLPQERREAIAAAAYQESANLHAAIGPAAWYHALKQALSDNIAQLDRQMARVDKRLAGSARPRLDLRGKHVGENADAPAIGQGSGPGANG